MTTNLLPNYMLWQETDPKKASEQVLQEAVSYYSNKYDQAPILALVPLTFPDLNGKTPVGLVIERHKDVKATYVWLKAPDAAQLTQPTEQVQE